MTRMNDMEDPLFKDLLRDYVSDTHDDGFSDALIADLDKVQSRESSIRRWMLSIAFLVGGLIAGSQFTNLLALMSDTAWLASASGSSMFPYCVALTFAFCVWMSLESRTYAM